jgi:Domain of unknown function (DUF4209)
MAENEHRYPVDLQISINDFIDCGWRDAIEQTTRDGYSAMWQAFSSAARVAIENDSAKHGKSLWLLADACSMMLIPSSQNEPFKPFAVLRDKRSVIADDFHESDITFFKEIVDAVDDNLLKARLADLVWLKGSPRDVAFALKAIDAYRSIPLDVDTWISDGKECWQRALTLAQMLGKGAGERLQEMEVSILKVFDNVNAADGFLGLWLAELLRANRLGRASEAHVANKLEILAHGFTTDTDLNKARSYFLAAANWFKAAADGDKTAEMTFHAAECWVKEANNRTSSNGASHAIASSFYENAIQTYRLIPRAKRAVHDVDARIEKLRMQMGNSGQRSLEAMGVVRSPGVDISQLIQLARESVTNKPVMEALMAFANLHRGANADELRQAVINRMKQYPLQALFASSTLSRDGRVIAKRPGMSLNGELTEADEIAIRADMIRDHGIQISIVVQGYLLPALDILVLEHRLREADFIDLASQSPIVPKDRVGLFGKALFAGYERDFVTALHLLIPQIEHMVRIHLKSSGAQTTNLDLNGIENENGMSTLMDHPNAEKVFGKNMTFELRALFCDASGPNLRNELAHGLLTEDNCNSVPAIYAWWFTLKLVFLAWWNTAPKAKDSHAGADEAAG